VKNNAVSKFLLLNLVTFWGQKKCVKINFFVKKPYFSRPKKNLFSENYIISTTFFLGGGRYCCFFSQEYRAKGGGVSKAAEKMYEKKGT
jgi:hypothetical protein